MYQQRQNMYYSPQQPKNSTFKTLAIICFILGIILHIIGLIPIIGFVFDLIAGVCDLCGFVFLCLI